MSRLSDRLRNVRGSSEYLPDAPSFKSELSEEYDVNQNVAQDIYNSQSYNTDITNPHKMYQDIVGCPSPRGSYPIRIMGRPIDVNSLEQYLIFKISPRTITTLMRYNDAKSIEDIKGYTKRFTGKGRKGGLGMLLLICIGAIGIIIVGYFFLDGTIPNFLRSMFGGMM